LSEKPGAIRLREEIKNNSKPMDDKTIQAALRDIRNAVKRLRKAACLSQSELSDKGSVANNGLVG
jgi:hypothetical protein